ncbi:MAG TPA: hypothetical protein VLA40_06570, partial [Rheinheimera sp.]|nr:hypothetical protein [Rheinheimera sp.]
MASLVSPGVSVTVEDQSFYAAAGTGTVPFILIATEQDKVNADGSGIAAGTTAAEAGKVKLITSQRDLIAQFGNPIFKTDGGTALHGHELNEYGLMAAYSFLGLANRAYIIRADLDLGALEGSSAAPVAAPAVGSYWLDTSSSLWGLKAWNSTTQKWEKVEVSAPAPHEVNPDGSPLPGYLAGTNFAVSYWDDQGNTLSEIKLYERITSGWQHIGSAGWDAGSKDFQVARHTSLPTTQSGGGALVNGDLVLQVNAPNNGSNPTIRVFNGTSFVSVDEEGFEYSSEAFAWFHANGGVSAGDLFVDFASDVATAVIRRHNGLKQTVAESTAPFAAIDTTTHTGVAFNISINDSFARTGDVVAVSLQGFGAAATAADVVNGINNGIVAAQGSGFALANDLVASVVDGKVRIVSKTGYNIELLSG